MPVQQSPNSVIDVHSHILPGMDDGARDRETSLSLLKILKEQGVDTVCATSHYYEGKESIRSFDERRKKALAELRDPEFIPLIPGAEVAFFSGISSCEHLNLLCYCSSKTLLLEMPFIDWTKAQVDEVISLVLERGYKIILAHPERYLFSKSNERALERFYHLPVAFQVNADTLTRWSSRKTGLELLQMTRHPLIGSDCHNMTNRAPHMNNARQLVARKLGDDFLDRIDSTAKNFILSAEEGCDP